MSFKKYLRTALGLDNYPKKYELKYEFIRYHTTNGNVIKITHYPLLIEHYTGYYARVIEYIDKERTKILRRHIIYLKDITHIEYKQEIDFKLEE